MKKRSKIMVMLLTLAIVAGLLPTAAFAAVPEVPELSDDAKKAIKEASDKFLEDPEGSVRKVKFMVNAADLILDVGLDVAEGVADTLITANKIDDAREDAEFEMDAVRRKIEYGVNNIGRPGYHIGKAQLEIDIYQEREIHEKDQINEDIENANKIIGIGEKLTGKDLPEIPEFKWFPQPEINLDKMIGGAVDSIVGGLFG